MIIFLMYNIKSTIGEWCDITSLIFKIFRFEFYNRAKTAFAIVATGESAAYGNIILKKGVVSD